ncbi:DUF2255 family protein [Galbitalea soli]|nr:DUF2255 family protein [Galbitalea soli]NYJ31879.1 hypothetical protein [Galbitalea soli]
MVWSEQAINAIARSDEVRISSDRPDGSARPDVIIWAVEFDGDIFVRSARGATNGWFRRAVTSGSGHITAGTNTTAVRFVAADDDAQAGVDAAYRSKYARYPSIVDGITGPAVYEVTLRLDPVD